MGFYGIINIEINFPLGMYKDEMDKVIQNISEFVSLDSVDRYTAIFSEESNFSYGTIDDLKSILEELKADNKIEDASINIWYLDEPDETIYI